MFNSENLPKSGRGRARAGMIGWVDRWSNVGASSDGALRTGGGLSLSAGVPTNERTEMIKQIGLTQHLLLRSKRPFHTPNDFQTYATVYTKPASGPQGTSYGVHQAKGPLPSMPEHLQPSQPGGRNLKPYAKNKESHDAIEDLFSGRS